MDQSIEDISDRPEIEAGSRKWMLPFFSIWSGQAVSLLGSQLVQFALIWWLTQTTGSATVLATATLVGLLPQVLIGPVIGVLVDRWNRRRVMIVADTSIALATAGLAILFLMGNVQVWHVYLLLFVRAIGGIFHWAAMQASTSLMVPQDNLSRVQGLNQILYGAMNIGSAPFAALLLAILPMQGILAIDIVTALLAVLPLLFIPIPQPARSDASGTPGEKASVGQELREGLRYVWAWPGLVMILVMATLINLLLRPATSLQPILVTQHFGGAAFELAWMESAWGIGAVVGGLLLSAWGGFRRRVVTSLLALVMLGAGMTAIGFVPASAFWIAVGLMFLVGVTGPLIDGPLFAVIQTIVAPEMQGRVFTLMISAASAMSPLGLIVAGPLADTFGVRTWYVVGGIITGMLGLIAFFIPAIVRIEDGRIGDARNAENQAGLDPQAEQMPRLSPSPIESVGD